MRQNTVTHRDDSIDQSDTKPDEAYVGIVPFLQIALALIMVLVAYWAITNEDLSGSPVQNYWHLLASVSRQHRQYPQSWT